MANDSLRRRLLDNVVETFRGMTTAGGFHFDVKASSVQKDERNLLTNVADTDLPFFIVQPTDKGQYGFEPANRMNERFVFAITVRADAPESSDYNRKTDLAEDLIADIEKALQADIRRGGNCIDTKWFGKPQQLQSVGEDNIVIVLCFFQCLIFRVYGKPDGAEF